jgi:hypothetical protein
MERVMKTYTNHSGGCTGSDMEWETQGRKYGVKSIAYSFGNHIQYGQNQRKLTLDELNEGYKHVKIAAETLNRPLVYLENKPYVKNLISRNWYQVVNSECIFAIGKFISNSRSIVDGGTGWAVQMAIDNKKPVFFYNQPTLKWTRFNYDTFTFEVISDAPILTENFAGIGTREIELSGKGAISSVYKKTFQI